MGTAREAAKRLLLPPMSATSTVSASPVKQALIAATGKPLDPKVFETHLRTRYLAE